MAGGRTQAMAVPVVLRERHAAALGTGFSCAVASATGLFLPGREEMGRSGS